MIRVIERIIDAPIKALDRALGIPEEVAESGSAYYERYRLGARIAESGAALFLGGLAANTLGAPEVAGLMAMTIGGLATYGGGLTVVSGVYELHQHNVL